MLLLLLLLVVVVKGRLDLFFLLPPFAGIDIYYCTKKQVFGKRKKKDEEIVAINAAPAEQHKLSKSSTYSKMVD